jgi:hypothetical protein
MNSRTIIWATLVLAVPAFCQTPATLDTPYQIRYASNLNFGESYINIINDGFNGNASPSGQGFGAQGGNMCVNVYAVSMDEEVVSCCSCLISPDQVVHLGVSNDLLANSINGRNLTSVTIKLIGSSGNSTFTASSCTNSAATAVFPGNPTSTNVVAGGYVAFGTTLEVMYLGTTQQITPVSTAFVPAQLSLSELNSLTMRCTGIIANFSGDGICNSCHVGALGATKK